MKPKIDWGTWLSIAAVVIVGLAVTLRMAPSSPAPEGTAEPKPEAAEVTAQIPPPPAVEEPAPARPSPAPDAGAAAPAVARPSSGYRLDAPDSTFELPTVLNEISGLSASKDPGSLWAVHDERGTLFRISIKDGSVLQDIELGKRGDYEAVEEADGKVYVARSEGVLFVVDPKGVEPIGKLTFHSDLGLACDLEGLGYEPKAKRLLLTCKNEGSKSRKSNKAFEIHGLTLGDTKLKKDPAYVLNEQAIDDYIAAHPEQDALKKSKGKDFAPSGIAVHPTSGEIYVSSTRGKMVVVLEPTGALARVYPLDPAVHAQPEGITFGSDGTMFISNEAHGKRALLHGFKYSPPARD